MINGVEDRPLFRGKMDNGEWLESDSIIQFKPHPLSKQDEIHLWHKEHGWTKIDIDTFGVGIGVVDKKGKKVFSDDILKGFDDSGEEIIVRILLDKYGLSYWINNCRFIMSIVDRDEGLNLDEFEIIGNTHDNKDLWTPGEWQ